MFGFGQFEDPPGAKLWDDPRVGLMRHYVALGVVSAEGARSWPHTTEQDPKILAYRARHNEGSLIEWRQHLGSSYRMERDPRGAPVRASIHRDEWTVHFDHVTRHGKREPGFLGMGGLWPCVYFLQIEPVSFLEHLSGALEIEPTAEEVALGATVALSIVHPELQPRTQLRAALDSGDGRVVRVDLSYELPGGEMRLLERYTFDDWVAHAGEPFPLRFTMDTLGPDGTIRETTCLDLTQPGSNPVPQDLLVPSGSTYSDLGTANEASLVGRLSGSELGAAVSELEEWVEARSSARLFSP